MWKDSLSGGERELRERGERVRDREREESEGEVGDEDRPMCV